MNIIKNIKQKLSFLTGVLLLISIANHAWAAAQLLTVNQAHILPGRYIVVFKDTVSIDSTAYVLTNRSRIASRTGVAVRYTYSHALNGMAITATNKQLQQILQDDSVAYIEPDQIYSVNATQTNATWGLDRIDQRDRPLNSTYTYEATGYGVTAYILDTGIYRQHSNFGGRAYFGYDATGQGDGDCHGHGTHVAGTVGSSTYGVAKNVTLVTVRVLPCGGSGSTSGVVAGMDWVAQNRQLPAVANMSLGGSASTAVDQALNRMVQANVTVVVAAGNDNSNACNASPARAANAITVASSTSSDTRSSFSNYGSCVDIFAPGSSITSTSRTGGTATLSGTSMASPHVAGAAALYLEQNPNATPAQVTNALTANASSNKISGANGSPNLLLYTGSGSTPNPTTELQNNIPVNNLSAAQGVQRYFTLQVPTGANSLSFSISGGSGDADLYVRFGASPTTSSYDCRPYLSGSNETCNINNVQAGTYHVMLHAYTSFSGITLVGSYSAAPDDSALQNGVAKTNLSGATNNQTFYYLDVPAGATNLHFQISGGSGDADLYVRFGAQPSTGTYDCRPYINGNNETCNISNAQAGRYHVMLRGYNSYSGVSLVGSYTASSAGAD